MAKPSFYVDGDYLMAKADGIDWFIADFTVDGMRLIEGLSEGQLGFPVTLGGTVVVLPVVDEDDEEDEFECELVSFDDVMECADSVYRRLKREKGYTVDGIQSDQVRALASALVDTINDKLNALHDVH
jgi:hypothetical protein